MSDTKLRLPKYSTIQKEAMVDFMELHPELRKGKYTKEFTLKMGEKLWIELSDLLNALPGSKKDTSHWRKTWQDLKTTVKEKSSIAIKDANKTGGGKSSSIILTDLERRVISLIGGTAIKGDSRVQESVVKMNWQSASGTNSLANFEKSTRSNDLRDENMDLTEQRSVPQRSPTNSSINLLPDPADSQPVDSQQSLSVNLNTSPVGQTHRNSALGYFANLLSRCDETQQNSPANNSQLLRETNSEATPRRLPSDTCMSGISRLSESSGVQRRLSITSNISRRRSSINSNNSVRTQQRLSPNSSTSGFDARPDAQRHFPLPSSINQRHLSSSTNSNSQRAQQRSSTRGISRPSQNRNSQRRLSSNSSHRRLSTNSNYTPNSPVRHTRLNTKQLNPRRIATQRLDSTIFASNNLIEAIYKKSEVKENYYRNKLELMEANVLQKQRIATSLEEISTFLTQT